ncbi:MAG: SDR family NAD(P)-dependent oxidoreductase [Opitutales bacterium]|jgi:NAD(P)-dependent dehydrogenase (short-subunit alcohol dehydrogenase family)|nr:SDR family NAD(P)-dependent oxidoreductase [Opitutales bacterium]
MNSRRIALVTGGNRGIGLQLVREFLERGFEVVLSCRNLEQGREATQQWGSLLKRLNFLELDVADSKQVVQAAAQFGERFECLDVLVNNAGILLDASESILSVSEEVIEQTIDTNSLGPLRVTKSFLPYLRKSQAARVINVSSLAGQLSTMGNWAPAYSISKSTLNAVTCLLSNELSPEGISVNAVSPGWIKTEMGGEGATGTLEEGADTILWLATEASPDLTGQFLRDRERTDW